MHRGEGHRNHGDQRQHGQDRGTAHSQIEGNGPRFVDLPWIYRMRHHKISSRTVAMVPSHRLAAALILVVMWQGTVLGASGTKTADLAADKGAAAAGAREGRELARAEGVSAGALDRREKREERRLEAELDRPARDSSAGSSALTPAERKADSKVSVMHCVSASAQTSSPVSLGCVFLRITSRRASWWTRQSGLKLRPNAQKRRRRICSRPLGCVSARASRAFALVCVAVCEQGLGPRLGGRAGPC